MEIKVTNYKHNGTRETISLASYCLVLDGSLADLFALNGYENVQTTKWAEHSGEVANMSIARPQAITFSIKVFGEIADLNTLNSLLADSKGGTSEQSIEAKFKDTNGTERTLFIPAEYVKMSSFSALSINGQKAGTIASASLEFKCSKNQFAEDSFSNFYGLLSNWTTNGSTTRTEVTRKSIQGSRYSFYELDESEIEGLKEITDIEDFMFESEMCLGSLGFTVLKGYYQSAYTPAEQNSTLNIKTLETDITYRSNSDKLQSRDIALKLAIRQPNTLSVIQCIGMLKRYIYGVLKRSKNALVFLDEKEGVAFKCYPKSCKVEKWTERGYAEMTLTLRSTDEIKTKFAEPQIEEAPEPEEIEVEKWADVSILFTKCFNNYDKYNISNGKPLTYGNLLATGEIKYIPSGAVIVGVMEYDDHVNMWVSFPPLKYFGAVQVYGVVTERIDYDDFKTGAWKNKVQMSGNIKLPYETASSLGWVTTSFVASELKYGFVSVVVQTDWNTDFEELKAEANGGEGDLWKTFFSQNFWNRIKEKIA